MKGYYKVPFRSCYANSIWGWVKYTWYCHIVIRLSQPSPDTHIG